MGGGLELFRQPAISEPMGEYSGYAGGGWFPTFLRSSRGILCHFFIILSGQYHLIQCLRQEVPPGIQKETRRGYNGSSAAGRRVQRFYGAGHPSGKTGRPQPSAFLLGWRLFYRLYGRQTAYRGIYCAWRGGIVNRTLNRYNAVQDLKETGGCRCRT